MTTNRPPGYLYRARTTHVRLSPFERRFSYGLFQLLIDIDRIAEASRQAPLLAYNRPGLLSFHDRDHGDRSGAPLRGWAEAALAQAGVRLDGGRIELLTFPRLFGYVFNPISVFFGYGPAGDLRGALYEVNNTFGDSHVYAAPLDGSATAHAADKRLHVSPFFDVAGAYRFVLRPPGERLSLTIENRVDGVRQHLATLKGERRALTSGGLLSALAAEPALTFKVIGAIHWEALHLWRRGAGYRRRPEAPAAPVTVAASMAHAFHQPS